jgi:hypothetical protein
VLIDGQRHDEIASLHSGPGTASVGALEDSATVCSRIEGLRNAGSIALADSHISSSLVTDCRPLRGARDKRFVEKLTDAVGVYLKLNCNLPPNCGLPPILV